MLVPDDSYQRAGKLFRSDGPCPARSVVGDQSLLLDEQGIAVDATGKIESAVRPVLALWGYAGKARRFLAGLLALELLANGAALAEPLIARWVLDDLQHSADVLVPGLVLAGVAVIGLVLAGVSKYLLERTAQAVVLKVRRTLVGRVVRARVDALEQRPVGDVLSRVGSDTTLLLQALAGPLVQATAAPFVLVAALVLMGTLDPVLFGVAAVLLGLAAIAERRALRRIGEATEDTQHRVAGMTSALQRVLIAFRTVKASLTEGREEQHIGTEAASAYHAGKRAARHQAAAEVVALASVDLTFLIVLALGAARVTSGQLSLGDLVAFLLYVIYLREPVESITEGATAASEGLAAVKRCEQLRSLPQEQEPSRPISPPTCDVTKRVEFEDVCFGYSDHPVLRDVTLDIDVGLTVLAGASGAGKTTMLSLIERFVDADRGRVMLDGIDVRAMSRRELRRKLAYVQQDAPLLGETIRTAALYGTPDGAEDELQDALRAVALDEWVARLPAGPETPVGERGVAVSGGQRQRLAIARALLRRADVLLLDEATSQLDPTTEQWVLHSISEYARNHIVIAAAHKPAIAAAADKVAMLVDGRIRAIGRHSDLLRTHPTYCEFVQLEHPSGGTPPPA